MILLTELPDVRQRLMMVMVLLKRVAQWYVTADGNAVAVSIAVEGSPSCVGGFVTGGG